MRIAVLGTGAVGGYFGGRLARAGHEVVFVARGATLAALRDGGLRVTSVDGDFTVDPVEATDGSDDVASVEAALACVKAWQLDEAGAIAARLLADDGFVVPLANGVEGPEVLAARVGDDRVLGGLCRILAKTTGPARVEHFGVDPTVVFGELDDRRTDRVAALEAAFGSAGVAARVAPHVRAAMWEKFLFIAASGGVGAVARATVGEIRDSPETRALLEQAMREIWRVARAQEIPVREDAVARAMDFYDTLPAAGTASMQRDLMEGRPSELEAQVGAVVRFGERHGVPTPIHSTLYAALALHERRARSDSAG